MDGWQPSMAAIHGGQPSRCLESPLAPGRQGKLLFEAVVIVPLAMSLLNELAAIGMFSRMEGAWSSPSARERGEW